MWLKPWRCGGCSLPLIYSHHTPRPIGWLSRRHGATLWLSHLFQRQRFFLIEEAHQFVEELHAVLFHHHRMGSLA